MAGSDTPRRILIGTTNPSKFQSLSRRFFQFSGVACVSPSDLALQMEIPETGATMAENAQLKARAFHRRTGLAVLSADSGLFFRELPMDDPRQPGPYIRRVGGRVLTDEEMLQYYSGLAREFGLLHACYCTAFAGVDEEGRDAVFFQDDPGDADFFRAFGFLMCSHPHEKRNPGWPLDSLSMDPYVQRYWFDIADSEYEIPELAPIRQLQTHFQVRVTAFLEQFFRLQRKQPLESH